MKKNNLFNKILYVCFYSIIIACFDCLSSDQLSQAQPSAVFESFLTGIETNLKYNKPASRYYDDSSGCYYVLKRNSIEKRPYIKKTRKSKKSLHSFYDAYMLSFIPKQIAVNRDRTLLLVAGNHSEDKNKKICSVISLATGKQLILKNYEIWDKLRLNHGFAPGVDVIVVEDIFSRKEWKLTESDKNYLFNKND